jgi:hypothetical protein
MEIKEKILVAIDQDLARIINEIAVDNGLDIEAGILKKIQFDFEEDMVSKKEYLIAKSKELSLVGTVDDYEPGDIWLTLNKSIG